MSLPIADLVTLLMSNGLSADVVGRAVELAQLHADASADIRRQSADNPRISAEERRRAYDRERQRQKRISEKAHKENLLPSSPSSDSQEIEEGVNGKVAKISSRGTRLPPDWTPSNADACFALPLLGERRMAEEVQKFRDYWHARAGPGGVKLDWSATWRNWIRKAAENGTSRPNGGGGHRAGFSAFAVARAHEAAGGEPAADDG